MSRGIPRAVTREARFGKPCPNGCGFVSHGRKNGTRSRNVKDHLKTRCPMRGAG